MRIPNILFQEIAKEAAENAPRDITIYTDDYHESDTAVEDLENYIHETAVPELTEDVYKHIAYGRGLLYYETWFSESSEDLFVYIANRLLPQDVGEGHIEEIDVSDCRNFDSNGHLNRNRIGRRKY